MGQLADINAWVNSVVWGPPMMILLIGSGIVLTFATGGIQFRRFGFALKQVQRLDVGVTMEFMIFQEILVNSLGDFLYIMVVWI